jgi:hypothetical protein
MAGANEFEVIQKDMAALRKQVAELIDHIGSATAGGAERVYEDLNARGDRSIRAISEQIRAEPLISVLAAVAIGFIASRLTR